MAHFSLFRPFLSTGLGVLWAVVLWRACPNDPSFNTLPFDATVQHPLGAFAAVLADLTTQTFGCGGVVLPFFVGSAGWSFVRRSDFQTFFLGTVLSAACFGCVQKQGLLAFLKPAFAVPPLGWAILGTFFAFVALRWRLFSFPDLQTLRQNVRAAWMSFIKPPLPTVHSGEEYLGKTAGQPEASVQPPEVSKAPAAKTPFVKKGFFANLHTVVSNPQVDSKAAAGLPPLDLLDFVAPVQNAEAFQAQSETDKANLETALADFGIKGKVVGVRPGPVVSVYDFEPAPGVKAARVVALGEDLARSVGVASARVSVSVGKNKLGIEIPNAFRETVYLRDLLQSSTFQTFSGALPLALGKDVAGLPVVVDLATMPHLLVAGATGSGKSVGVNAMILSLITRLPPARCRLLLIDPKILELSVYDGIPHLLAPVITDALKAVEALKWVVGEMERRYRLMAEFSVRNLQNYNASVVEKGGGKKSALETLPWIVVVLDEMADLMVVAGKDMEAVVQRLAQMARAAGIHLIMATQRPSVDVITGTIKANFPSRMSYQVVSKFDSMTILGQPGAETALPKGDLLFLFGGRITRVHGPLVSDREVERIVRFLSAQGKPNYVADLLPPAA